MQAKGIQLGEGQLSRYSERYRGTAFHMGRVAGLHSTKSKRVCVASNVCSFGVVVLWFSLSF